MSILLQQYRDASSATVQSVLRALKTLGQDPAGAETLGTASGLSTLLGLVASLEDDPKASNEALRCIANTLLLTERARSVFTGAQVNGGGTCIFLLEKSTESDQIFILSRILFCSTIDFSPFIFSLVEAKPNGITFIDILPKKPWRNNILVHYPRSLETPQPESTSDDNWSAKLDPVLPPLFRVFHSLVSTSPAPISAPLATVISCLIWIPTSRLPAEILWHEHHLLEAVFSHYFPNAIDPDDPSVRELAMPEAATTDSLDKKLIPLVALITQQCVADQTFRTQTRDWLCPSDLDRSAESGALESRPNMLGRCLRLLGSVYHAELKTFSKLILASKAATMSTLLGYGNVAGFLFTMGITNAPPAPAPSAATASALAVTAAENINPMTGTAQEARPPEPELSPEEKERELEKLFVLFDRFRAHRHAGPEPESDSQGDGKGCPNIISS
ncbi:guanine nucleotide exchange factor synembryn-domain-containing protein [Mycena haematopus]|nr:guanine nucleotide exchange factor synembryn-domain-containing protein [Mycena haematopus]